MLNVSFKGLFAKTGFDYETLSNLYTDEELKNLIERSMMTKSERMDEALKNFKEIETQSGVNTNVQTDIKSNNQTIKHGDVHTGYPNPHLDSHLQGANG